MCILEYIHIPFQRAEFTRLVLKSKNKQNKKPTKPFGCE